VFFILPPNWLHPLLRNTEDLLVYLWQEEMFDCGFMEKVKKLFLISSEKSLSSFFICHQR
jgi:hypothetical protein